jgi:dihydroxyacetone kinase-like protein
MKKLINAPETVLAESLDGFAAAHADLVTLGEDRKFVRRAVVKPGKVALISGGGSGHEPLHAGFVGHGMLDAACPGQVFTSPTPDQMMAAAEAVDGGAGVLFIVKNYEGDVMNFDMAREMEAGERAIETVLVDDDVAVEASTYSTGRRGVAGTLVVEKIAGAAAERGDELAACRTLGERANKATRSMGVALTSCTVPAAGKPTFQLGEDEIEVGVGIHGEPGRRREKMTDANKLAKDMVTAILDDLQTSGQDTSEVLLLVNGFGGTPLMELYVMYQAARASIEARGLKVTRSLVGNYVTALDMAGCSLTVSALDGEMTALWDAPVHTPALRWRL